MENIINTVTKRKVGGERPVLMIPLNVVMTAKITGHLNIDDLTAVLEKLRRRHALLAVCVYMDENHNAWQTSVGVPDFIIEVVGRISDDQWISIARQQLMTSFEIQKGPLVRFAAVHGKEKSELIICGHHLVCDGMSMTWLIRDILKYLADPGEDVQTLPEPPVIDMNTVSDPPGLNKIIGVVVNLINKKWRKYNLSFTGKDKDNLHEKFREQNKNAAILTWEIPPEDTSTLVRKCREEGVTVNTALWTAFLGAQYKVQGKNESFCKRAGMAVNTRDKLKVSVGEAFGFYASSLTVKLPYNADISFWDMSRQIHKRIQSAIEKNNPFQRLVAENIHPSLLDSLYFSKYGMINNSLANKFLCKMQWDKINYGYSITNVGKMDIPVRYGNLQLDSVYGPIVYSDVNEKTVGVVTVGGKMTLSVTYNKDNVSLNSINKIKEGFNYYITNAIETGV